VSSNAGSALGVSSVQEGGSVDSDSLEVVDQVRDPGPEEVIVVRAGVGESLEGGPVAQHALGDRVGGCEVGRGSEGESRIVVGEKVCDRAEVEVPPRERGLPFFLAGVDSDHE